MGIVFALFCAAVVVYPITIAFRLTPKWKAMPEKDKASWCRMAVLWYRVAAVIFYSLELRVPGI
jgi:hypothetical protein